jgi:GMP synthase (glutamine-hydrolysing)
LTDVLSESGFEIRYLDAGRDDLLGVDATGADLLVGLGGPVSVYEAHHYPWINDELRLLERRVRAGKPTLGICLGAQMLAHVLGARVYAGPVKELGWKPLSLTAAGRHSSVSPLAGELTSMLHWHGDTFDLPERATLLASTTEVPHQVYEWGQNVLAFQCHPEVRASAIESWVIGHACEIAATAGVTVAELRQETARLGPALERQARQVFDSWLTAVGLG